MPRSRRPPVPVDDPGGSSLRRVGIWILAAKVAAVALFFDPRAFNAFAVPKATLAYMFSALLLGLIGALAIRYGRRIWRPSAVDLAVALFAAAYVAATLLALNVTVALIGAPDRALGLLSVLDSIVLYASVVVLVRTRTDAVTLAAALFLPILPVTAYALIQWAGLDPLPWKLGFQTFATSGNSTVLSLYLGTLAVAAATTALLPALGLGPRPRAFLLALAGIALVGTLLAGARVALIGFAMMGLVVGPLLVWRIASGPRRRRMFLGYFGAVAAAAVLLALTPQARSLPEVVREVAGARSGDASAGSVAARSAIYEGAIAQVRDRPLLGVGPDNYTVAFGRYHGPEVRTAIGGEAIQTSPHSWVLHVATDAGLVGLIAFVAVVGLAVREALRREALPIGLAAVAALAFSLSAGLFTVNDPGTDWLPWLAIGTCAVAGAGSLRLDAKVVPRARKSTFDRWTTLRYAAMIALALVVAAVLVVQTRALWAGELAGRASSARLAGEPRAGAILALRAIEQASFRAEYWHELGLAYAALEDYRRSSQAFERAVELAPYHSTYLTNLARSYVALARDGDRTALDRAVATVERAVTEDPNSSLVGYTRAFVMLSAGRPADAAEASERALQLGPPAAAPAYQVAARAYLRLGRPADAERWLQMAFDSGHVPTPEANELLVMSAEVRLATGRRAEAARELAEVFDRDPDHVRARAVVGDLAKAGASELLLSETFRTVPTWTVETGTGVGSVRTNVLTAQPSEGRWRVIVGGPGSGDIRMSVQFRFPPAEPRRSFEIGRWADPENMVVVRHDTTTDETTIVRMTSGTEAELARDRVPIRADIWYWLEVELRGSLITAIVFESGEEPRPKGESRVQAVLSAENDRHMAGGGQMVIASRAEKLHEMFAPPVQVGGIAGRPGGAYLEALR